MAHPDDAEMLCAGTLIRLADAGWTVHVATATAGDCGSMALAPRRISTIRRAEARKSAALCGATYHCLGEKDGFVFHDKPTMRKAMDLFRKTAPSVVFAHAPSDYMIDHEVASVLARSASFLYPAPNVSAIKRRPGSAVPHLYYCDPIAGIDPSGKPVRPTTVVDISDVIERKATMLACHESQREWLRRHHGMDEYIERMKRHGSARGELIGKPYAEGFVQHRGHAYPGSNLLGTVLGAADV
ncbi:MAG: PIG-L family deacetylase [Deltaproteobacteria bacterium]|nr:PIG-L family deacetylase [Deltaproteobacteria bacterium]